MNSKEEKKIEINEEINKCTDEQLKRIQEEVESLGPLITKKISLSFLEEEFKNHEIFLKKIQILKKKYSLFRRLRRDGSCFYRALIFAIFEQIIIKNDVILLGKFTKFIKNSKEDLKKVGYEEIVTSDFQEVLIFFLKILKFIINKKPILEKLEFCEKNILNLNDLEEIFCEKFISDSFVMYMRFLTSCYLKTNSFLYENYLDNGYTIDDFCSKEVDPIDREADQVQIMALISYLDIPIKIVYLDTNTVKIEPQTIYIPEDCKEGDIFITLLYRPGHYDILYL